MVTNSQKQNIEWSLLVREEKDFLLVKYYEKPLELLICIFELSIDNLDCLNMQCIFPELYECLFELYSMKTTIISKETFSLDEIQLFQKIDRLFSSNKEKIREFNHSLFYALLNFRDMLKKHKIPISFT